MVDNPREIALFVLNRFEKRDAYPDRLLDTILSKKELSPKDRGLATELVIGTLRWLKRLDWVLERYLNKGVETTPFFLKNILRLGIYQILFLSQIPSYAIVNEMVTIAKKGAGKKAAGMVNAILRKVILEKDHIPLPTYKDDPAFYISIIFSHPLWLVKRWIKRFGVDETEKLCEANNSIPPITIRTNTLKIDRQELFSILQKKGYEPSLTIYSDDGINVKGMKSIADEPLFMDGFFTIQDEASQIIAYIVSPPPESRVLDLCAAPGGKTTHMAQLMKNKGKIVAVDRHIGRLSLLEKSCQRLGISIVDICHGDALNLKEILKNTEPFDYILIDAPCSGLGVLRRNPDIKYRLLLEDIKRVAKTQKKLINEAFFFLKQNGVLVYSVCTFTPEETYEVINSILQKKKNFIIEPISDIVSPKLSPFITKEGFFLVLPNKSNMDGFFSARGRLINE